MYIIAIAWIYVVVLMSFTEDSIAAGLATFLFYGLAPLALLLYLMGTPQRRRNRRRREALLRASEEGASDSGSSDPGHSDSSSSVSGSSASSSSEPGSSDSSHYDSISPGTGPQDSKPRG